MRDSACIWQQCVAVVLTHIFVFLWWMMLGNICKLIKSCKVEWTPSSHSAPHCLFGSRGLYCSSLSLCIFQGAVHSPQGGQRPHPTSHPGAVQLGHQCRAEMGLCPMGQRTILGGIWYCQGRALTCYCYFELTLIYCTDLFSKLSFMFLVTDESV